VFDAILLRRYSDRQIMGRIAVTPPPRLRRYGIIIMPDTICVVCGQSDRQDSMISCLACGCLFHLECLIPPIEIPSDDWFCPFCRLLVPFFYMN
jgi:hypothetical protein